ncbi:tetratricopeptide repeat protein [Algoriphagus sp. AGSA1]|uniref:tetratricopeptide repeat protein n=1 Tax=Algoriphagus sp. AGSA1 TaxID=2907213 RepID=UPI001F41F7EF|nr:tetratricopeptide repeat protein [Algoriphagus sp. AGSA1]MCE7056378.1 tetratricopeptide repeat protein [Algoriphagus sp. AGSA1]
MDTDQSKDFNNQAVQFFMNGELEKAKESYHKALEKNPKNATSLNNLGLLYHQKQDFETAIQYFNQAVKIEKKPVYYLNTGNSYAMKGDLAKAENYYQKAINLNPNYTSAYISLAKLATHQKKYPEAIRFWKQAIKLKAVPEFLLELAKTYMLAQEFEIALEYLSQMENRDNPEHWFLIGKCEYELRNHGLAEKAFKTALALMPDNKEYRQFLGLNFLASGEVNKCMEQFNFILQIYPKDYKILTEKAVVLCSISSFEEALTCLEKALELKPDFRKALHYKNLIQSAKSSS